MNPNSYSLILSFLLHLKGLFAQTETVVVRTESVCAPTGSSVILWTGCVYPNGYIFNSMSWKHRSNNGETVVDPGKDSWYRYINNQHNCFLRISGLKESDTGSYHMSFTYTDGLFIYKTTIPLEVSVHVTDLQVTVASERVTEGQKVTLTCNTSCPLTSSKHSFLWWKNETRLDRHGSGDALRVSAVSREDSGRYSCAMEGFEEFRSNETLLAVSPPDETVMERAGMGTLVSLLTLVALLLICATLCLMIRKKPQSLKKHKRGKEKLTQNDTKDSTMAVTFDLEEKGQPAHQEEVQYSHVHFSRFPNAQSCAEEAEVQYSEIAVRPSSGQQKNCRK